MSLRMTYFQIDNDINQLYSERQCYIRTIRWQRKVPSITIHYELVTPGAELCVHVFNKMTNEQFKGRYGVSINPIRFTMDSLGIRGDEFLVYVCIITSVTRPETFDVWHQEYKIESSYATDIRSNYRWLLTISSCAALQQMVDYLRKVSRRGFEVHCDYAQLDQFTCDELNRIERNLLTLNSSDFAQMDSDTILFYDQLVVYSTKRRRSLREE